MKVTINHFNQMFRLNLYNSCFIFLDNRNNKYICIKRKQSLCKNESELQTALSVPHWQ